MAEAIKVTLHPPVASSQLRQQTHLANVEVGDDRGNASLLRFTQCTTEQALVALRTTLILRPKLYLASPTGTT